MATNPIRDEVFRSYLGIKDPEEWHLFIEHRLARVDLIGQGSVCGSVYVKLPEPPPREQSVTADDPSVPPRIFQSKPVRFKIPWESLNHEPTQVGKVFEWKPLPLPMLTLRFSSKEELYGWILADPVLKSWPFEEACRWLGIDPKFFQEGERPEETPPAFREGDPVTVEQLKREGFRRVASEKWGPEQWVNFPGIVRSAVNPGQAEAVDRYEGSAQEKIDRLTAEVETLRQHLSFAGEFIRLPDKFIACVRLAALLASEEPPEDLVQVFDPREEPGVAEAAWRWFREQLSDPKSPNLGS